VYIERSEYHFCLYASSVTPALYEIQIELYQASQKSIIIPKTDVLQNIDFNVGL
jgi:hypothetical protein